MDSKSATDDVKDVSVTTERSVNSEAAQDGPRNDDAVIYPGSAMRPLQRRALVFSLCLALFLCALDITIVATALPTITRSLNASAAEYAWIGSSYTLSNTSSTPIWAKLSDIFGRKSMLMLSNGLFMAGSLIAALAISPGMLIAGRTVQGLGAGGLTVLVTIVVADLFRLEERAKYYALTAMVFAVASALGPVLGGVFTEAVSWRWCFYINLPFDGLSIVLLFFALKLKTPKVNLVSGLRSLDWIGCICIVGGTLCFLFGLETGAGGLKPWSSIQVVCLLVFGLAILLFFILYEAKLAKNPLIPTRIFSSRTNVAAFATTCLHSFAFIQMDYFLPLYYQAVLGHTPIISGVSMIALVLPLSCVTVATGFFVQKTGNYLWPMYVGGALMTLGTGLSLDFRYYTEWAKIILFPLIMGLGVGPLFQTPMLALQSHVEDRDMSAANSALSFMRTLFTSISIVIGSVLLQNTLGGGSLSDHSITQGGIEEKKTYVSALRNMWGFYTAVSGLMLMCSFAIKGRNIRDVKPDTPEKQSEQT